MIADYVLARQRQDLSARAAREEARAMRRARPCACGGVVTRNARNDECVACYRKRVAKERESRLRDRAILDASPRVSTQT